jgi:hypothetical protein
MLMPVMMMMTMREMVMKRQKMEFGTFSWKG